MSTCRSCGAPIVWGVTEKGKRMPLDEAWTTSGTPRFIFLDDTETIVASAPHEPGHVSHFATCPNADQHRRPR